MNKGAWTVGDGTAYFFFSKKTIDILSKTKYIYVMGQDKTPQAQTIPEKTAWAAGTAKRGAQLKTMKTTKTIINKTTSSIFCKLPWNHPEEVEVIDKGYCLETQTGHILSHNPLEAKIMLEGGSVRHYKHSKKQVDGSRKNIYVEKNLND